MFCFSKLISQRRGDISSYYHFDALGSTHELTTDDETTSDTYLYDAFGKTLSASGSTLSPFRYVGQEGYYFDEDTDHIYVRARTYDPATGRWISRDPIGFEAEDSNLNRYVRNNVANATDPSGLQERCKRLSLPLRALTPEEKAVIEKHFGKCYNGPLSCETLQRLVQHERDYSKWKAGQQPPTPLMGEAKSGEDKFRDAAKRNGVPDAVIDLIIETANATEVEKPGLFDKYHNYCEQWVIAFENNLRKALNAAGYKDGLKFASKRGITGPLERQYFYVRSCWISQDHTTTAITFKDGTKFYIDCGTLSTADVNELFRGTSRFTPAAGVPTGWIPWGGKVPRPKPIVPNPRDIYGIDFEDWCYHGF